MALWLAQAGWLAVRLIMSGPPSWIDTGGDDEGSAGDGGYGGGAPSSSGSEWASGGPPSFQLTYSHTDRGQEIETIVLRCACWLLTGLYVTDGIIRVD